MKLFTILGQSQEIKDQEDLFAIRDGFSFLAFLIPPLWFLWRGMWLHAGLSLLALIVVALIPVEVLQVVLSLVIALWVGFEARFLHLEFLQKLGLVVLGQVQAQDSDMARDIYLAEQPKSPMKAANPPFEPMAKPKSPPQQADLIFGRS